MPLSTLAKRSIVISSNTAILALSAAGVMKAWDDKAFQNFLESKLGQVWPYLMIYPAFMVTMSSFSAKFRTANHDSNKETVKTASAPSTKQARHMAISTSIVDYLVVGALLLFWDCICRHKDGSLCPFTAAGTLLLASVIMPIKEELQCRFLFRNFISPHKLNSWPYSWKSFLGQVTTSSTYAVLNMLLLCFTHHISFDSVLQQPRALLQIWAETRSALIITDFVMHHLHHWMHEKAYFLHKRHHKGTLDLTSFLAPSFDLLDMFLEFGAAVPVLIFCKQLLGLEGKVHLLTHNLLVLSGFQHHSGNPYAVYLFNPVLDYCARSSLSHSLHHAVPKGHLLSVNYAHFVNPEARKNDIVLYNKHMRTAFPRNV